MSGILDRGGRRRGQRRLSEINVTPLVDVMLVLLVIFIVTVPMLRAGLKVSLPAVGGARLERKSDTLVLTVSAIGQVSLGEGKSSGEPKVDLGELPQLLAPLLGRLQNEPLLVAADGAVPYAVLAEVLSVASRAGAARVSLLTERKSATARGAGPRRGGGP